MELGFLVNQCSSEEKIFLLDFLVDSVKPVIMGKYELEQRKLSKLTALLEFSDYEDSNARNEINTF